MRITVPMGSRPGGYVTMQYQPKAPPPAPCIPAPCIPQQQPSQAPPTYYQTPPQSQQTYVPAPSIAPTPLFEQPRRNIERTCQVTIPPNTTPGTTLRVQTPPEDGNSAPIIVEIVVPPGARPGETLTFAYEVPPT